MWVIGSTNLGIANIGSANQLDIFVTASNIEYGAAGLRQSAGLDQWLSYLEQLHPKDIDLGLDRVTEVAERLGLLDPPPACRVLTVAGTNGKGSCVETLVRLLGAAGRRVGSYTSPHLIDFNERICVDGQPVSDEQLCQAFSRIDAARGTISLSYFEFATLAALLVFASADLDVMVLEVGLGGRLDAVNILDPDIAIICSIALDHEAWLGNTREAIALEKGGILRQGGVCICVDEDPPAALLDLAAELGVSWYGAAPADVDSFGARGAKAQTLDYELCLNAEQQVIGWRCPALIREAELLPIPDLPLPSVIAALQAFSLLGFALPLRVLKNLLNKLSLAGRYQCFTSGNFRYVVDVAHNPAATQQLARRLQARPVKGRTLAVFGAMADKNIAAMVAALKPCVDIWFICGLDVSRAVTVRQLELILLEQGCQQIIVCEQPVEALEQAQTQYRQGDRILVCGSFYTAGKILARINPRIGAGPASGSSDSTRGG